MSDNFINDIVIAFTTLYNTNSKSNIIRRELAKKTILTAKELGYGVIVVDAGSDKEFLQELEKKGIKIANRLLHNAGSQKRQAIEEAYKTEKKAIVITEPEKIDLLTHLVKAAEPVLKDYADIVIPKRNSLASYPTAQQYAEPLGNAFFKELTNLDLDIWFGPQIWKREHVHYFFEYDGTDIEDWQYFPILKAIKEGKKIVSVNIDYTHPKEQTEIEEHDLAFYKKRIEKQLLPIMNTLITNWNQLHSDSI